MYIHLKEKRRYFALTNKFGTDDGENLKKEGRWLSVTNLNIHEQSAELPDHLSATTSIHSVIAVKLKTLM